MHVQSLTVESDDTEASSIYDDRDTASNAHTGPECPEHTARAMNWERRQTN